MESVQSLEEVHQRIDEICYEADLRRKRANAELAVMAGGMAFLTAQESVELHRLKLMLPTFAEQREAAAARVRERIANRRKSRTARQGTLAFA